MWIKKHIGNCLVPDDLSWKTIEHFPDCDFRDFFEIARSMTEMLQSLDDRQLFTRLLFQRECQHFSPRLCGARARDRAYVNAPFVPFHIFDSVQSLHYADALEFAWRSRRQPCSKRFLKDLHLRLLPDNSEAGKIRRAAAWIGERYSTSNTASIILTPPEYIDNCLTKLGAFSANEFPSHRLAMCAMLHYQFTAIHPFLDANGRTVRILTPLLLRNYGVVDIPWLFVSESLLLRYWDYHASVISVDRFGEIAQWVRFFVQILSDSARRAERVVVLAIKLRDALIAEFSPSIQGPPIERFVNETLLCTTLQVSRAAALLGVSRDRAAAVLEDSSGFLGLRRIVDGPDPVYQWHDIYDVLTV
jgi:Fic family protein